MIAFVINVHRDEHLAVRLIDQITTHYPEASLTVIPDEPRLKTTLTGEWTQRYLERGLATNADVVVKIDPDTCIWRRAEIPGTDWFGTINDKAFVRGGACGFSRSAAERLVASGLLLEKAPFYYARYSKFRWPHEEESDEIISCQDRIVGRAMSELKIPPSDWPGVFILGNGSGIPEPASFAITHPHPQI